MKNKHPELLRVGDLVTSDFYKGEENLIRRITNIEQNVVNNSGYLASADGGEPCPYCHRQGHPIVGGHGYGIDASWFVPVE